MITNVCDFLEKSVEKYPDKTLFVDRDKKVSYKEFDNLSNKLASKIISLNIKNSPILIIVSKSIDTLVSFFGVAKSGNFYTLLDEKTPISRINDVIEILKPKIIITKSDYPNRFNIEQIYCEDIDKFEIDKSSLNAVKNAHIDTNLLYVFFTSGSTGVPKGVSISHKSVIDFTFWVCETFDVKSNEILANQSQFYFDNSVLDIFSTIKAGATLHILQNQLFSFPKEVLKYLIEHKITMIFWVPSVLIYFANTDSFTNLSGFNLNKILFAGEIMPNKQLNVWRQYFKDALFANLYGPTEITVDCAYYICDREFKDDELLPIGKACKNTEILLFDESLNLIAPNEPFKKGELCVRGTSLSFGYYANKDKSGEVFIQNPLHNNYRDIIYKTGDIAAYNEHGELLCYGRKDNQIKYLSIRIELGDIETVLNSLSEILNAVCIFKDREIICFYEAMHELNLKNLLKDKLPNYMIPRKFIKVDSFRLNQNGKIDRKVLFELI
ncbi:amino acid adenylation domain-containing protein [Campylobacter sp. RM12327]|uniref:amino acid adenylation domain-containing protein n=1 Tax=Campylobacter sputorum TaxID=206 RepID=UPI000B777DA4|nr:MULTISPECIES: amino acid adenylation domain-containing protein [Campylobacter]ASM40732.1 AMP-forming adenylation domain superfamily protein, putative D-alanine:D-alanyl carrier protein ligase [Campylobacter sputorum]MBE7357967.1 amino acid adenylation domain-containing protein [Campylobacter sp. RM11302]MBF6669631.1 amino acid adenylation domain-containing protein [Campylobacter sp. RM12327]MBF6674897.1 amino acid adenylation domain-containing protein [Campylobacter sp. RM13538]MBF6676530.1